MTGAAGVAAIVLAAGSSRRMPAGNKLLMPFNGQLLARYAVNAARDAGIDQIIAVVAQGDNPVIDAWRGLPVRIVENLAHAEGIASSIRSGVAAVSPAYAGALVMLADMPLVAARHLRPLLDAFATAPRASIVVPCHRGQRGNPVLWSREYFGDLLALSGDTGARGLLERHAQHVLAVDAADDAVLVDIDTPQDWSRVCATLVS